MLTVRLTRGRDSKDLLTCIRADGTSTWQRVSSFFPLHDLAHLAVEATLGIGDAFFGLIDRGWDMEDFSRRDPSELPPRAIWVESVVFAVLTDHTQGGLPASELDALQQGGAEPPDPSDWPTLEDTERLAVKRAFGLLLAGWQALAPGESVEWSFEPGERTEMLP